MSKLKEVFSNKGFVELLVKSGVFCLLLILELYFVVWREDLIPVNTAWFSLNIGGFGTNTPIRLILFMVLAFILLSKQKLATIKKYKFRYSVFILYFLFSFLFAWILKSFRTASALNPELIENYFGIMIFLKFFLPAMLLITLFIAVFDFEIISYFWKKLKKEIGISIGFAFVFFQLVNLYQAFWPFFSRMVVRSVAFLLRVSMFEVSKNLVNPSRPTLSVNNISIEVGKACSGIDSQMLFISLFAITLF